MQEQEEGKKAIKANRVREGFAAAAMEMIHEAGVESVSIRKVADKAGYSLGTVYNHFKNLDELLWLTRERMLRELKSFILLHKKQEFASLEDIKAVFQLFMDYFVKHPNVFRFFYNHPLSKAEKPAFNIMDDPAVQGEFAKTFSFLTAGGRFTAEEVFVKTGLIIYAMFGMLTMYISNNDGTELSVIRSQLDSYVELLFG